MEPHTAEQFLGGRVSGAIARHGANQTIVSSEEIDPDRAIAALDEVGFEEVREIAANLEDHLAIACVGPHTADEFSPRGAGPRPSV